jgi:hypothetical protein
MPREQHHAGTGKHLLMLKEIGECPSQCPLPCQGQPSNRALNMVFDLANVSTVRGHRIVAELGQEFQIVCPSRHVPSFIFE